jgi:hypothetical protein
VVFLAAVWDEQQEAVAGVAQQEEVAFFFAKMQWPLEQLLSRRLEEMRARVRSDFMVCSVDVLRMAKGRMTHAKYLRA